MSELQFQRLQHHKFTSIIKTMLHAMAHGTSSLPPNQGAGAFERMANLSIFYTACESASAHRMACAVCGAARVSPGACRTRARS